MFFKTSRILIFIAFIAIYIIWGSTYLLNKVVVTELPPFFLASIRFLTAGISMITIAAILKVDLSISKKLNMEEKGFSPVFVNNLCSSNWPGLPDCCLAF